MRLDQYLVKSNICSRSEAKQYIKKGRVIVNGKVCNDSALHIDENTANVLFDGKQVAYEEFHYYMLNKPEGCVSATKDGLSQTVIDILKDEPHKGLFPVGRLDKDTQGLLLITDDGKLAHDLLAPRHHVDKTYFVQSDISLTEENMELIRKGMDIGDDKNTLPAQIIQLDTQDNSYNLTICEGRFHQVKRMFEGCGARVTFLKRLSMGPLKLDDNLKPGEYRKLSNEEISILKNWHYKNINTGDNNKTR